MAANLDKDQIFLPPKLLKRKRATNNIFDEKSQDESSFLSVQFLELKDESGNKNYVVNGINAN